MTWAEFERLGAEQYAADPARRRRPRSGDSTG